jgi:predicted MFS family arabinose efflux permease
MALEDKLAVKELSNFRNDGMQCVDLGASTRPVQALRPLTNVVIGMLTCATAIVAAGSYFAQPIAATIGRDVGLSPRLFGLIVTLSQAGYVFGLLFIAPLGDKLENRRLLLSMLCASVVALSTAALAPDGAIFLAACFGVGVSSISVQMLVTLAAFISDPARRGQVVGTVTSGLLVGILLAWPAASFASARIGWRSLFAFDALVISALALVLRYVLPRRMPENTVSYVAMVGSLWKILRDTPELRQRAFRQALLFGGFSLFWTAAPSRLLLHFGLDGDGIALFGLIGGSGALIAPIAGRLADAGRGPIVGLAGMAAVLVAFLVSVLVHDTWTLCLAAILINAGVQSNHVVSQRVVLSLAPDTANRLNAIYIATFFVGGAIGSAVSIPLLQFGWTGVGMAGSAAAALALGRWIALPSALRVSSVGSIRCS